VDSIEAGTTKELLCPISKKNYKDLTRVCNAFEKRLRLVVKAKRQIFEKKIIFHSQMKLI
jgi:hypothetical protein